jgi:hypothetical protein
VSKTRTRNPEVVARDSGFALEHDALELDRFAVSAKH